MVLSSELIGSCCVPQFPQKCSLGETRAPHALHSTIFDLFHDVEAQERFSDNNFVAVAQDLALSRR